MQNALLSLAVAFNMHFAITYFSIIANKFLKSWPPRTQAAPGPELIAGPLTACWPPNIGHEGRRDQDIYKPSTVILHCCQPIWTGDTRVKWVWDEKCYVLIPHTLLWTLSFTHTRTYTRNSSHLFSALSLLITSNVTGRVFPPHCWELLPGFWTSQLPGNKPLPCNTDGTPLRRSAHARAQTHTIKTPVRLHAGRSPIPTHRTSDSPQLLARHYFEEASLSFTSYSS